MYTSLNTGAVGVRTGLAQAADLAARYGFGGLHLSIQEVTEVGAERAKEILTAAGVRPAAFGLPVDCEGSGGKFEEALSKLPYFCTAAKTLGLDRTSTWVPSWHDELDWAANYAFRVDRFGRVARVLAEYGIRLGLEFLGPKTLRDGRRHVFIHTMDGMLELCATLSAETGNVGLLLDAWHWYTAGGTWPDLDRLTDADIVDVHVNDAPAGIPLDEQIDQVRALPGETGVIGIPRFLRALKTLGYTGPVMVEPFSARVNAMAPEEAVRATAESLQAVWREAGL